MQPNLNNKTLSQIAEGFNNDINPGELEDLLESVRTLSKGLALPWPATPPDAVVPAQPWAFFSLPSRAWELGVVRTYKMDLTDIDITIKRKPRKQKPV